MHKQNKVVRLTEEILSRPQLITPLAFAVITDYLAKRNEGLLMSPDDFEPEDTEPEPYYDTETGIGVLNICGSLTAKPLMTLCGEVGTSYQSLLEQTEEMLEAGIKTIVMNVSSGGGEAYSCFSSVAEFRAMVDAAGAYVYGYADGCAASAAYAWLCSCDEVYAHPDSETGSIGVVCGMIDDSKYMDNIGLKRVYVHAGESKIPYAEDGTIRPEFIADLQYKIDALYENFVAHVAEYTGIDTKTIKGTEAKTFLSKDALTLGLIDGIKTQQEFESYVSTKLNKEM